MTEEKQYIDIAIEEIFNPTLEITKQHVEVLNVQLEIEKTEVARVHFSNDLVSVYFKIKDERFFLVINLTKCNNPKPTGAWIESGHRVYLTATSEDMSFQKLKSTINLHPLSGWSIGELRPSGKSKHSFSRISFEPNKNEAYGLEEKLSELLTELEKDSHGVLNLTKKADTYISVCKHQYVSGNAGILFDLKTINRLQKLKLPIGIDTYIVGDELKD